MFSIVFVIVWQTLNYSFVNHFNQMEDVVFIILQIFFATCAVLKIGKYHLYVAQFKLGIFSHVACLDQWHEGENI